MIAKPARRAAVARHQRRATIVKLIFEFNPGSPDQMRRHSPIQWLSVCFSGTPTWDVGVPWLNWTELPIAGRMVRLMPS